MSPEPNLDRIAAPAEHRRIVELDALRALAALNLLAFHFTHVYEVKFGYVTPLGFEWPYGAYGVELFFVLSGYVNSMSLLRRGNPTEFVAARLIRIVPLFLIVIVLNLGILQLAPHAPSQITWSQFAANLTLTPKLFGQECFDPVMWTLQVEIMFYGALTFLYRLGLLHRYFVGWGLLVGLSFLVCPGLDALTGGQHATLAYGFATALRKMLLLDFAPLFAIGFLIYMIRSRTGAVWQNAIGILVAVFVFHSIDHGKHNPAATLLIIATIYMAASGWLAPLRFRPLVYISSVSYPIYLCHNNLGCSLIHTFNHAGVPSVVCLAVAAIFSIAVAILVTNRVEQPISRFLRKLWAARNAPVAIPVVATN